MIINIRAQVRCTDGEAGRCTRLVVKSTPLRVTRLVAEESEHPNTERLASLESVISTDADGIKLIYTRPELTLKERFIEMIPEREEAPDLEDDYVAMLRGEPQPLKTEVVLREKVNIAADEVVIDSSTLVKATDGWVGPVVGLEVEQGSGEIISLVMRAGHFWHARRVAIPAAQLERLEEKTAFVSLDRQAIDSLPTVPVVK